MRLLEEIPKDKYDNIEWNLNYLKNNPIIGNESVEKIQIFHAFWIGEITELHFISLRSLKEVHPDIEVFLWCEDSMTIKNSKSWKKIKSLWGNNIEVIEVYKNHFIQANSSHYWDFYKNYVNSGRVGGDLQIYYSGASDIVRFLALELYGGVWFDLDNLFLRSLDSIKIKRYCSQWGKNMCGNSSILRLEKNHNLMIDLPLKLTGEEKNPTPFFPRYALKMDNGVDINILPSAFFDIAWILSDTDSKFNFDEFFHSENPYLPDGIYTYHWHNRWSYPVPKFLKNMLL